MVRHRAIRVDGEMTCVGVLAQMLKDPGGMHGICENGPPVCTTERDEIPALVGVVRGREPNAFVSKFHAYSGPLKAAATKP